MNKPPKPKPLGVRERRAQTLAAIRAAKDQACAEIAARRIRMAEAIGDAADEKTLAAIRDDVPVDGPRVALLRLGLQRSGRLVEKQEVEHSGTGAVLVIPAQAKDVDEWIAQHSQPPT